MPYSEAEAYKAMYPFLLDYYDRTKADDIGALLGDLQLLDDGPAVWQDWINSLNKTNQTL